MAKNVERLQAREAKELIRREKQLGARRNKFYMIYLFMILSLIYITDDPNDAPDDIELHFNETYRPSGPYGAAGCGEAPLDAPHPAILNAIYNATGARITRVPARPEKVLAALKELEK